MMDELPNRDAVASAHDAVFGYGVLSDTRDRANSALVACALPKCSTGSQHLLRRSVVILLPTALEEKCDFISCVTSLS